MTDTFTLTENHIKLLRAMYVGWQDCESGAPEIDPKRPYGNGDVPRDVARIVGEQDPRTEHHWRDAERRMNVLHRETATALQIVLCTGEFKPGTYQKKERYDRRSWVRVSS